MRRISYRRVRLPGVVPGLAAIVVRDDRIEWVGPDDRYSPPSTDGGFSAVICDIDLDGALVTPAFVDAHVHATATGLALGGLDLAAARSRDEVLAAVAAAARRAPGAVVLGTGWDETDWPDPRPPTADELENAAGGAAVYLSRADVHSALASRSLIARCPGVESAAGFDHCGQLRRDAHHAVRAAAMASVTTDQRIAAQRRTRAHAASLGIGALHEMAGPEVSSVDDLEGLLRLAEREPGPEMVGYWGALGDVETPRRLGVRSGGDLFCDGAIGSHTAALWEPYVDRSTRGHLYHDDTAVAEHIVACARAGLQTGFHAIGDRALDAVAGGLRKAAAILGPARIRAGRHRVEHAELPGPDVIATFADLGVVASVQPAFDARWGGADGMYARRLGSARAAALNPLRGYLDAGVALAFGSDAPVTPLDPWGAVRAAVCHHEPASRLTLAEAFAAATTGGAYAAHREATLHPGAPATFAVWDATALPDLTGGEPAPACLRTVVRGQRAY